MIPGKLAIHKKFQELFNETPLIVSSPGRVNIIGEHTDYNNGFVLPVAIDRGVMIAVSKRKDNLVNLYSDEFTEYYKTLLSEIRPVKGWPTYVLGVVRQLQKKGFLLNGFDMLVKGNVPIGAGLSSSAAIECAAIYALDQLFDCRLSLMEMAMAAQAAEQEFAGVRCGIMDQFASLFGRKNMAMRLDCRTLEYEYIPLQLDGYKILLLNTNIRHSLASSEYNKRRAECEQGVEWIAGRHWQVRSLRDASIEMLDELVLQKDKTVYKRCKYVIEENARLLQACNHLQNGSLYLLGKKMFQSHHGLSKEYEVSCKELDFLITAVENNPVVIGARMMGGGFGGCTINLVKEESVGELIEDLAWRYKKGTGLDLTAYIANSEDGTRII